MPLYNKWCEIIKSGYKIVFENNKHLENIEGLRTFFATFFPIEGILYEKDQFVGIVKDINIQTPTSPTISAGGVGGPRVAMPGRKQPSQISFHVSALITIDGSYHIINHSGNGYSIVISNVNISSGGTLVTGTIK